MSKYNKELKLKAVKYCIDGNHGYGSTAKKFNIKSRTSVVMWVKRYKEHGEKGLEEKFVATYSGKYKESVLKYMHKNRLSATSTAIKFNLSNNKLINEWERIYYEEGPQALYEERRGKSKNMSFKSRKKKLSKEVEEDLIAENQRLRMENEYLKKLNALVQKRVKRENKKK